MTTPTDPAPTVGFAETALPSVVLVTGTGTDVGKTVATAALTASLRARGSAVAVVKPAQSGVEPGQPGDLDAIRALLGDDPGVSCHEFVRVGPPLAPDTAARVSGVALPTIAEHVRSITALVPTADVVLVEGAGGLLVRLDSRGGTLADLGVALRYKGVSVGAVLVVAAGLGTLNHTALTAEALRARQLPLLGVVIGSWPTNPGLAERSNLDDLPVAAGAPLLGLLPQGVGSHDAELFRAQAPTWFTGSADRE